MSPFVFNRSYPAPCSSALCLYSEVLSLLPPWPSHSSSPMNLRNLRTVSKSPTSQHLSPDFAKCSNNQKAAHLAPAGMLYEKKKIKINGTEKIACKKKKEKKKRPNKQAEVYSWCNSSHRSNCSFYWFLFLIKLSF